MRVTKINKQEERLLEKLQVYLLWAARYMIPLRKSQYQTAQEEQQLSFVINSDPQAVETLFQRLATLLGPATNVANPAYPPTLTIGETY